MHELILGLLLHDDRTLLDQLRYGVRLTSDDFPQDGDLWVHILQTADEGHPVLPGTVATLHSLDESRLRALQDEAFSLSAAEAISYARQLVEQSDRRRAFTTLQRAAVELEQGKALYEIQMRLATEFGHSRGAVLQDAKVSAIGKRIIESIDNAAVPQITPTGILWFDTLFDGGFREGSFIAIGGRQKGRKTSLARNLMLGAARNPNASIALLAYENDQVITYYDLVAMEAARIAFEQGLEGKQENGKDILKRLSGGILMNAHQSRKLDNWPDYLRECIHAGIEVVNALPIWIYDTQPANGGLDNLESLLMVLELHRQVAGDKHLIYMIDYAQLVNNVGKDYEDMKALTNALLKASINMQATIIVLTQFNEAANWSKAKGEKVNHLGTKGGGSLEAAVQYFFTTEYDPEDAPDWLNIELSRSRRSGYHSKRFHIHAASGLLRIS